MLDDLFAEALVHKPIPRLVRLTNFVGRLRQTPPRTGHVVLGVRLRAFSNWHAFNLDLIHFAAEKTLAASQPVGQLFTSLLLTALCCSVRYPQVATRVTRRVPRGLCKRFSTDIAFRVSQIQAFIDYRKDYAECLPEIEGGDQLKIPVYLYNVHLLRRMNLRLSIPRAWDAPLAQSQWNLLGQFVASGAKIDVLTPEDRRDMAEVEKDSPLEKKKSN